MQQLYFNQLEQLIYQDLNNLTLSIVQALQDQTLYQLFGQQSGAVRGSFLCSYVGSQAVNLAAGVGFYYDSTQTNFSPKYQMIAAASTISITGGTGSTHITAPSGANDRIDLVCLTPNFAVTQTALRYVKQTVGGVTNFVQQTVNKLLADGYTLQVVAGTPAGSPTVPSCPSGYIPIAQLYIHQTTGLGSQADITDVRVVLATASPVVQTKTGTYQMLASDKAVLASGTFNVTLPAAASVNDGQTRTVKNTGSGTITVVGTIDGESNYSLADVNSFITVISDGSAYWIVAAG